jgi:hypothetical protein
LETGLRRSTRIRNSSDEALRRLASVQPNYDNPVKLNTIGEAKRKNLPNVVMTMNTTAYAYNSKSKKQPKTNKISAKLPEIPKNWNHMQKMAPEQVKHWMGACKREWQSHLDIPSFVEKDLSDLRENKTRVGHALWVFDLKLDSDDPSQIVQTCDEFGCKGYKARMVYMGSNRTVGRDHTYTEVFANVLKIRSVRIMLACALHHPNGKKARCHHQDIKVAFLSAKLYKQVLMWYPQGFKPKDTGKVLMLLVALYGLPESMRIFIEYFQNILLDFGFTQSKADPAIFILTKGDSFVWVPVFVDDMFITENDPALYERVMKMLRTKFVINDLGELRFALGIRFRIDFEKVGLRWISKTKKRGC